MSEFDKKGFGDDEFWDLGEYSKKKTPPTPTKPFPKSATEAVEIIGNQHAVNTYLGYSDSKLSPPSQDQGTITRFIPPHKDSIYAKKHIIFEYAPQNLLIKSVKVCADKPDEKIFPENNLFIRERRALLNRTAEQCPRVAYYSYSPRYSQMSRAQLNWYLWWRENVRKGNFLKTDESYVILYAYELAATGEGEDKLEALRLLCALLTNYSKIDIPMVFVMMIRDLICDFCLVHGLQIPLEHISGLGRILMANLSIPEIFLDLSEKNRPYAIEIGISALSMYDYKKNKLYSSQNAELFKRAMNGAIEAVFFDNNAFYSIMSFTSGVYGSVTVERKPFSRMINIVNKSIRLEICYFQSANIQSAITDALRYSENKLREHLGVKNKLHIMSINPDIKNAIDRFFEENYPALPTVDRRRKQAKEKAPEVHEYDRFYDVPQVEISPERALEIERESWSTTQILTEAFSDSVSESEDLFPITKDEKSEAIPAVIPEVATVTQDSHSDETIDAQTDAACNQSGLFVQIKAELGDIADFITLCKAPSAIEQRKFASLRSLSVDAVADRINECAADIFGDIILENVGGAYAIIEDYSDQI